MKTEKEVVFEPLKKKRGRPKKEKSDAPKKPKGKRGRPKKQFAYDIVTGKMEQIKSPIKAKKEDLFDSFVNQLTTLSKFEFLLHDGTPTGAVEFKEKGNTSKGLQKLSELYLINERFRNFINNVITGAMNLKAARLSDDLKNLIK